MSKNPEKIHTVSRYHKTFLVPITSDLHFYHWKTKQQDDSYSSCTSWSAKNPLLTNYLRSCAGVLGAVYNPVVQQRVGESAQGGQDIITSMFGFCSLGLRCSVICRCQKVLRCMTGCKKLKRFESRWLVQVVWFQQGFLVGGTAEGGSLWRFSNSFCLMQMIHLSLLF